MFPTTCATTAYLSEPARAGDMHTMPARSPSLGGIPSRAIKVPGMFATLGVNPAGYLDRNPYNSSPKVTNISPDSNLHSIFMEYLLWCLINLSLSNLLTPTIRTCPLVGNIGPRSSVQFSSVAQSCQTLCDPMNHQASLSITISQSSLRLTSIESVMPSSHLILGRPLLLLPPVPPSIRLFSMSQPFA